MRKLGRALLTVDPGLLAGRLSSVRTIWIPALWTFRIRSAYTDAFASAGSFTSTALRHEPDRLQRTSWEHRPRVAAAFLYLCVPLTEKG